MRISDWSSDVCSSDLLRRDDPIEGGVGKRELQRVAVDGGGQRPGCRPSLAARSHGGEEPGDVLQLSGGVVERNDARAAAERLEGVANGACSEVEEQIALAHPELIEANGEHQRACSRRRRSEQQTPELQSL